MGLRESLWENWKIETKLKIGYLPLTKQNWTNATLEKARADALAYLKTLPGVEVVGGEKMIETEAEALEVLKDFEAQRPDLLVSHFMTFALAIFIARAVFYGRDAV